MIVNWPSLAACSAFLDARRISNVLKRYVAGWRKFHREPAGTEIMPKLLSKRHFNVGLIVDHENGGGSRSLSWLARMPQCAEG